MKLSHLSRRWITDTPIAHRGLHDEGLPENSLAAFDAAANAGYAIEFDIRLAKDRIPVVFHDGRLDRMTDRDGRIRDLASAEITEAKLSGSDQHIPTFDEMLRLINGRVPLLTEIKMGDAPAHVMAAATARHLDQYNGAFAVQSFDPEIVGWFADHRPDWPRGQLAANAMRRGTGPWLQRFELSNLKRNHISRPDFIGYAVDALPNAACEAARARGLPLIVWTVKTPEQRARARRYADNVIFEGYLA